FFFSASIGFFQKKNLFFSVPIGVFRVKGLKEIISFIINLSFTKIAPENTLKNFSIIKIKSCGLHSNSIDGFNVKRKSFASKLSFYLNTIEFCNLDKYNKDL
ncbi:hypothetical protein CDIK_4233, partial [Cucumispora dikerogammari]